MIVEDEQDTFNGNVDVDYDHVENDISNVEVSRDTSPVFATYLQTRHVMHKRGNPSTTSSRLDETYLKTL